jgi:hypothetical protein
MQHIEVTQVLSKFYKKQGNNMKPQSSTEEFSVFSKKISLRGEEGES